MHPRAVARELVAAVLSSFRFASRVVGPSLALMVMACAQERRATVPTNVDPVWSSPFSAKWRVVLERASDGFVAEVWNDSSQAQAIGSTMDWELSVYSGTDFLSSSVKSTLDGDCVDGTLAVWFIAPGEAHRIPIESCARCGLGHPVTHAEFKVWFSEKHGTVCSEETVLVIHPRFDGAAP